jgi:hypothetical protein
MKQRVSLWKRNESDDKL